MSWLPGFDLVDTLPATFISPATSSFKGANTTCSFLGPFFDEAFVVEDRLLQRRIDYALDILVPTPQDLAFTSPVLDLVHLAQIERWGGIRDLADRVAALEIGLGVGRDRKYKWTAEIEGEGKDGVDRKYKWVASTNAGGRREVKWTEEYRRRNKAPSLRTYTFEVSSDLAAGGRGKKAEVKKGKKAVEEAIVGKNGTRTTRVVEITDPRTDQGAVFLKKAFEKRALIYSHGKRKELSPEAAAMYIQRSFRAHLIRRSQVLRGLRDLAVAKAKLKEIRALFSNISYRRRIGRDAEENQRFSEKIIVLILAVDAIEGLDYMVRAAKKSMVDELDVMLETIDPQSHGSLGSSRRRRKFDLPESSAIQKEMELGVAEVVQLLNQEESSAMA